MSELVRMIVGGYFLWADSRMDVMLSALQIPSGGPSFCSVSSTELHAIINVTGKTRWQIVV